jgi:peptide/nickel transport system substrate-binding protein
MSKEPLATGPWKLAKWEPNTRIVLEPNENFTGPPELRAKLNRVIIKIQPEYTTRLIELQSGKIDMMESINIEDADRIRKENPEINLVRRGWRSNDYIAWNMKNPLFADKAVRIALAHAVDTNEMIGKLLTSEETGEVYAKPSIGTITPALCGVHNDDVVPLAFNLEKAKSMLAEAGWTDSDGDGSLDKDGQKFEFLLSTNNGNKRRSSIQILIQAQLAKIGIKVNLEKQESNTFYENLRQKKYDAAVAGWSAGLFVDPEQVWHCDTEDRKYEFNFVSYCNPEVDALIEKGLKTPDPKEAAPIWKELQAKIYADQPYLFLWWMDEIVGIHERFENTDIDILSPLNNLHQWEVPPEKVKYKR